MVIMSVRSVLVCNRKQILIVTAISVSILVLAPLISGPSNGDGGYIPVIATPIYEPGQNAVISWNGTHERMCLSVDIFGDTVTEGFHIIPFPTEPEVTLGTMETFDVMKDILESDDRIYSYSRHIYDRDDFERSDNTDGEMGGEDEGEETANIMVTSEVFLEGHDISIIRVDNKQDFLQDFLQILDGMGIPLDLIPEGMTDIIHDYVDRDITYFSIDRYNISSVQSTMQPVIFEFPSEYVYFPMQISSLIEYGTSVSLSIIHPSNTELDMSCLNATILDHYFYLGLNHTRLYELDPILPDRVGDEALLTYIQFRTNLKGVEGDIILPLMRSINAITELEGEWPYISDGMVRIKGTDLSFSTDGNNRRRIICLNGTSKSIAWDYQSIHHGTLMKRTFLPFDDRNMEYYPIFFEHYKGDSYSTSKNLVVCFEPSLGYIRWETSVPWLLDYITVFRTITDHNGLEHILLGDADTFYILDMKSGRIEKQYRDFWYTSNNGFEIVDTPDGDKMIFNDYYDRRGYCFDPFVQKLPSVWGDSYHDPNKEYLALSSFNRSLRRAFYYDDVLYGVLDSNPYNGTFELVNLGTGDHVKWFDLDLWSMRDLTAVGDYNKDGKDEMIIISPHSEFNFHKAQVSAYDLETNTTLWVTYTQSGYYSSGTPHEIIDWGGDGDLEILITGKSIPKGNCVGDYLMKTVLISLTTGEIIWEDETTLNPLYDLYHGKEVHSMLFRDLEGNFHVRDDERGRSKDRYIPFSRKSRNYHRVFFADFDGNGLKEIVYINPEQSSTEQNSINYMDPYENDTFLKETLYTGMYYYFNSIEGITGGDSVLIQSKNVLMWITGVIDTDKEKVESLLLDQKNVVIPHRTKYIPPPPEKPEPVEPVENTTEKENNTEVIPNGTEIDPPLEPVPDNVTSADENVSYDNTDPPIDIIKEDEFEDDDNELDSVDTLENKDKSSVPVVLISSALVISLMIILVLLYPAAKENED